MNHLPLEIKPNNETVEAMSWVLTEPPIQSVNNKSRTFKLKTPQKAKPRKEKPNLIG